MRTLLVDDDTEFSDALATELRDRGWEVDVRGDAESAFVELDAQRYHLVLSDVRLPRASGLTVLRRARVASPGATVVLMTSFGDVESVVAAMRGGATAYLEKPFEVDALAAEVLEPLEDRALVRAALEQLDTPPQAIVAPRAERPASRASRPSVAALARGSEPIVFCGPPGSGRALAARLLHQVGPRSGYPCIVLDARTLLALVRLARRRDLTAPERAAWPRLARAGTVVLCEASSLSPSVEADLASTLERWFITPASARARLIFVTTAVPEGTELAVRLATWGARWVDVPASTSLST